MLKKNTLSCMNYLLYPAIFEKKPWEIADRVATEFLSDSRVSPLLNAYIESIDDVLVNSGWRDELEHLIAVGQSEEDIKRFLVALRARLTAGVLPTNADRARHRTQAGESCPLSGFWFTPAQIGSRRYFKQGDVMPEVGGDYGATIWQWDPNQDPPKL